MIFFAASVVVLPEMAMTQSLRGAFAEEWQSMNVAPMTIIPDHPLCSGPGEVAFAVELVADNLDFRLEGDGWNGSVYQFSRSADDQSDRSCIVGRPRLSRSGFVMPETLCDAENFDDTASQNLVMPDEKGCFLVTRRGTEEVRQEVSCGESDAPSSLNSILKSASVELNFRLSADLCQSLTGIGILDSDWVAEIDTTIGAETYEGVLGEDHFDQRERRTFPTVQLNFLRVAHPLEAISDSHATGPFYFDPMRFMRVSFSLELDPAPIPRTEELPVTLRASREFIADLK